MTNPTPKQIREARQRAGLTQAQAGAVIGKSRRTWQNWEFPVESKEHRPMDSALFELFLIKTKNNA